MKTASERMRERLRKDRPMAAISLRMPEDVIEDLKEIVPALGLSAADSRLHWTGAAEGPGADGEFAGADAHRKPAQAWD